MTVAHVNFYENLAEAKMRLLNTVVMYDKKPYMVIAIAEHKDGVFRMYLRNLVREKVDKELDAILQYQSDTPEVITLLDKLVDKKEGGQFLRKKMNSPKFNKFKPFPLGMCNQVTKEHARCYFLERQPQRHREQGLTGSMVNESIVSLSSIQPYNPRGGLNAVYMTSEGMYACMLGQYPSAQEVLENLKDPDVTNEAVGFSRLFALIRGPVGTMFLGYKDTTIGLLENGSFDRLRLSKRHIQTKELIQELNLFKEVI